jgi:Tfp pilus assembly PilM family ATPase
VHKSVATSSTPSPSPSPTPVVTHGVTCSQCSAENLPGRRFCGQCGLALFFACPFCKQDSAVDQRFCGACGGDLRRAVEQAKLKLTESIQQASELIAQHRVEETLECLTDLNVLAHPALATDVKSVEALRAQARELRKSRAADAKRDFEAARQAVNHRDYPSADQLLKKLPREMDVDDLEELREEVSSAMGTIASLTQRVRKAIAAKQYVGLLPSVTELLALDANNTQWLKLQADLANIYVKLAVKYWKAEEYGKVLGLVRDIPERFRNDTTSKLLTEASEADLLVREVMSAPYIDGYLEAVTQRLPKYVRSRKELVAAHELLQQRRAQATKSGVALITWRPQPEQSRLGLPVSLSDPRRIFGTIGRAAQKTGVQAARRLAAAYGLALQGLGAGIINTNLLPQDQSRFFGQLNRLVGKRRKATATSDSAWGIDVGGSGLHAVRLVRDGEDDQVLVEKSMCIDYPVSALLSDSSTAKVEQLKVAFEKLMPGLEESPAPVALGISGINLLHRMLTLPPTTEDKLEAAIRFESKHLIPFDLSEVRWDYHIFAGELPSDEKNAKKSLLGGRFGKDRKAAACVESASAGKGVMSAKDEIASLPEQQVKGWPACLIACKQWRVDELLSPFHEQELEVVALQSSCFGVYNWARAAYAADLPLAVLDVGYESSDLIVVDVDRCWLRTWGCGTKDICSALVRQCRLTHDQAWNVLSNPENASKLSPIVAAAESVYQQMEREIQVSLRTFATAVPELALRKLVVTGGGSAALGLARYLTHGPLS